MGCIQDVYNSLENSLTGPNGDGLEGGNYNYSNDSVRIQGQPFDPNDLGCLAHRCGTFNSIDYSHGNGTFHLDAANPWFIPIGSVVHLFVDVIAGHTWWKNGIPRH